MSRLVEPGSDSAITPWRGAESRSPIEHLIGVQPPELLASFVVGQARVLEMVVAGTPLGDILTEVVRILEEQAAGMLCSILLLSEDGRRVRHGAAPSLPAAFVQAIEDQEIGPHAGSCGTAAYLRKQVVVTDIADDPLWSDYREAALAVGLRACWSTPILSRRGEVLGTFAMYYREPAAPTALHVQLIALATHLAGVAIERARTERDRLRLVSELDVQRRALESAGRQKDQILGMLAHELRNPLAAISNATALARLRLARGLDVDSPLTVLERQVRNSSRLLDDLLDVARLTRGMVQLRLAPVRLQEVVAGAVEGQRALIERRGHALTVSMPPEAVVVEGDATRLEQAVSNLLNNAAKYSPDGSRLEVRVEREPGSGVVRVRDNGVGLSPDLLPHVFDLFVQADQSLARSHGGLGLGLPLVQNLVMLHGGTVRAFSEGPGRGSEFVVTLPVHEGAAEDPAPQPVDLSRQRQLTEPGRVLIVEDNQDAATTLREVLLALGYEVDVVQDGATALEAARGGSYQVVLLDIGLPIIDGYEVARRLRAELRERSPTLIALTGYGMEEDRRRALAAGIQHHLTKPFAMAELEQLITQVLGGRRGDA
jgi:signal transduction histidine kinase/ActR/RegA family two-component response regulator